MFLALFLLIMASVHAHEADEIKLCNDEEDGWLTLAPKSQFIMAIPSKNDSKVQTVFVHPVDTYDIGCHSTREGKTQISFDSTASSRQVGFHSPLNLKELRFINGVNSRNLTIGCSSKGGHICRLNFIVIKRSPVECNVNETLSCSTSKFKELANPQRETDLLRTFEGYDEDEEDSSSSGSFETSIKYSFFDQKSQNWVYCDEFDEDGKKLNVWNSLEEDTAMIRCPIRNLGDSPMPVLIRMEERQNRKVAIGLPILTSPPPVKSDYTYFSILVNTTVSVEDKGEHFNLYTVNVIIALTSVIVIVTVVGLGIFVICRKARGKKEPGDGGGFKAFVDIGFTHGPGSGEKFADAYSVRTESTNLTNYDKFIWDIFDEEEVKGEKDLAKRRKIIERQLSGDPSKINPEMCLNQQATVLPYNPMFEIDRSNFTIGQLLGSGNFGSVYIGEASGLFHPGSKTKVAIKTVNDALDSSQLTALLCEIKILTKIEMHISLVSILGACTNQLDRGELYLLLEYCPHGDLKTFLIANRYKFSSSELDSRLLLRWCHSIAKGMQFLASKRIMHGDLAARNILIGENFIAKVSDFGLSKTMYDKYRYRKTQRKYVPWKWMAMEYLTDACFHINSDVWSYGVVMWEMFSLGHEPYAGQDVDQIVVKFRNGYRLESPEFLDQIWWAKGLYETVMLKCWIQDPGHRCNFSDIVEILEKLMEKPELGEYKTLTEQYRNMQELLMDESTRFKRTLSVKKHVSENRNSFYQRVFSLNNEKPSKSVNINAQNEMETEQPPPASSPYLTLSQMKEQEDLDTGYITVQKANELDNVAY